MFATLEVNDKISQILIGVEFERLGGGASSRELGSGIGRVVVPHEFGCGIITDQIVSALDTDEVELMVPISRTSGWKAAQMV